MFIDYFLIQEKLELQEKKIAEQQTVILSFIEKEKDARNEIEKRQMEEKERAANEKIESQATLKQDMTDIFDAKVYFCVIKKSHNF
jgi:hypothetical protein